MISCHGLNACLCTKAWSPGGSFERCYGCLRDGTLCNVLGSLMINVQRGLRDSKPSLYFWLLPGGVTLLFPHILPTVLSCAHQRPKPMNSLKLDLNNSKLNKPFFFYKLVASGILFSVTQNQMMYKSYCITSQFKSTQRHWYFRVGWKER